ncbi:deoxynucleoside kinase [Clostridium tarantellae]|uniref:Deoxynucleoside kinase domain-containing protein n=1 Tax=Clostridium tarantellae TaxID=39493 RepID=A0A6I1MK30_9CLOT|nr:deoxynucleoside kinase [Clostridium tarantellae]MPQ42507.1 hypothetical protein [Clostridium tarantellae]
MVKKIIAFEGHNGVGKSTIGNEFAKKIRARFIYGVDEDSLTNGLKEKFIMKAKWYPSALHFIAGTMETKRKLDEVSTEEVVVLDRSYWSTLAVIWDRNEKDKNKILNIFSDGRKFLPVPDIIFILKASYETCNERINSKNTKDKNLDKVVNKKYYDKEKNFYNWLIQNKDEKTTIISIDTDNMSKEDVYNACLKEYKKTIREEIKNEGYNKIN